MASETILIRVEFDPSELAEVKRLSALLDEMRPNLLALIAAHSGGEVMAVAHTAEAVMACASDLRVTPRDSGAT